MLRALAAARHMHHATLGPDGQCEVVRLTTDGLKVTVGSLPDIVLAPVERTYIMLRSTIARLIPSLRAILPLLAAFLMGCALWGV
jgi:hypothetical protein